MGLQVFSKMTLVVEALLTNRAGVASRCLVLIAMVTDVMLLEVDPSVKAWLAHLTRQVCRCLQRFLGSEGLGAKVAHGRLSVFLERRGQRQVNHCVGRTA